MPAMIIALEGIDGSGKSAVATSLADWLRRQGFAATIVRWTSFLADDTDDAVGPFEAARRLKIERDMGPLSFALWHCADFAHRWEMLAKPALERDEIVLSDRYKYSGLIRGTVRGTDEGYLRAIYGFVPDADLTLYLDVDPAIAFCRKVTDISRPGYYESGNDVFPELDRQASFLKFQTICRSRYPRFLPPRNLHKIDASLPLHGVCRAARQCVAELLPIKERVDGE